MAVASLLDLGASEEAVRAALAPLAGEGFELRIGRVEKAGLDCCDFDVVLDEEHDGHDHDMAYLYDPEWTPREGSVAGGAAHPHAYGGGHERAHHHRSYAQVREVLATLDLTPRARSLAEKTFRLLAQAESKAHGVPVDEVHFHEVGAIDAIVDVVAAAVCLDSLGVEKVIVPRVVDGTGMVRCQHGVIPVPVPAVVNIAADTGLPLSVGSRQGELVTPTGAAIAAAAMTSTSLPKRFLVKACGMGVGKRDYDPPSILRALLIEEMDSGDDTAPGGGLAHGADPSSAGAPAHSVAPSFVSAPVLAGGASAPGDWIWKLECNIDDSTGEMLGAVLEDLMAAGARDAHFLPVFMKKNRPAYELAIICDDAHREALERIVFAETTTIGIRRQRMERSVMDVSWRDVETSYGIVRVKVCRRDGLLRAYPEYESVRAVARAAGTDFRTVYLAAATSA
ncbi:hypothetical protein AUL39_04155 [Tractidigestivibacter scatoligenes]|uniref:Nickel-pincer cofactor biosynthesis protein LarC n=2 Tax=Tractidigestivibacter scatoligenes TaxID=1299998 RepID=A0A117J5C8_TRASO|nr:hypothetical protein AUL39_04155 [Tractidigestivibacter scatoligenes]